MNHAASGSPTSASPPPIRPPTDPDAGTGAEGVDTTVARRWPEDEDDVAIVATLPRVIVMRGGVRS